MELTSEEKSRILAEEKLRLELRQELEKPKQKEDAKKFGIFLLLGLLLWFFWNYILIPYILPMLKEMGM